jgi:hypothetical protein
MTDVVQKLWGFCHTLRHDGIDYGDYIEQITYLLFLKMADERRIDIPRDCDWPTLRDHTGTELTDHYIDILRKLGKAPGLLGDIYAGAQSRFKNPVNLKRLIGLIDETEWTALDVDVKAAYEGLLEKAASEGKKGAGQYFTPRVLIQSVVRCIKPDPRVRRDFTICAPACGTGDFLVAAYEWLKRETVCRVEALFRLADAIEKRVAATARTEKLTQAILAKAFRGDLVPTEAELARREGRDYEPASVLLERFRAERAGATPTLAKSKRRRTYKSDRI